jgi:hypothetical protein
VADTTRDILYRTFKLNDSAIRDSIEAGAGNGKGIDGSVVDSWDLSDMDVVQFQEKRALQDGMDVGDVYIGGRRLKMAGTLYGSTRGVFYDLLDDFLAATNPVLAQREVPLDKGYLPLYFAKPTNRLDYEDEEGMIELFVNALPRMRQYIIQRDQQGGSDNQGLAIPWQATFLMRDPAVYGVDLQDVDLTGGGTTAGDFENRGNYIARLNMLAVVGSAAGSITLTAGGVTITISIPASTGNRTIRYKGFDKVLTFEENSIETIRMDKLILPASGQHPIIPPGTSAYSVTFNTVVGQTGSHMWFYEAYA